MPELNLTLVAFHGTQKPEPLTALLRDVQNVLSTLCDAFEPYSMSQMHATLLGLEADVIDGRSYGHWFRKNRDELREVSVDRLHRLLSAFVAARDPLFSIRFGGFSQGNSAIHSCDRTPYEGSFYAVAPGPVMITGWPVDASLSFTHGLYEFRRSLEQAGFSDKYHYGAHHDKAHWQDDDCFIRIGTVREAMPIEIQERMRKFFANMQPLVIPIAPADVSIIQYANSSLREQDVLARIPLPTFTNDPASLQSIVR